MSTFSTAFGSLPSYNDMLGRNNTTGGGLDQYNQPSTPKPKRRSLAAQGTQPPPTFAELQKNGRARPAPPAMAPLGIAAPNAAAPPPPMLNALGSQLSNDWTADAPPPSDAGPSAPPAAAPPPPAAAPPPPVAQGLPVNANPPVYNGGLAPSANPNAVAPRQYGGWVMTGPNTHEYLPNEVQGTYQINGNTFDNFVNPEEAQRQLNAWRPEGQYNTPADSWRYKQNDLGGWEELQGPELEWATENHNREMRQAQVAEDRARATGGAAGGVSGGIQSPAMIAQLQSLLGGAGGNAGSGAGGFGGSGSQADSIMSKLMQQLGILEGDPSGMSDADFETRRRTAEDNLKAEYGAEKQRMDEEMARRGIYSSSIASGRMGDLAGQQARALATMNADLLKEKAQLTSAGRGQLISGYQGAAGTQAEREMRAQELMQEAKLKGQELSLTQARDMANREYQQGQLSNERLDITSRNAFNQQQLEETRNLRLQNLGISNKELDLKATEIMNQAKYQGRQLDLQEARDLAEVDYRTKQLMQEDKRLTYEQARDIADRELKERSVANDERATTATIGQNKLDYALREKLGMGELSQGDRRLSIQERDSINNFLASIIPNLGSLPEEMIQQLYAKMGLTYTPKPKDTPAASHTNGLPYGGGNNPGGGNTTGGTDDGDNVFGRGGRN